MQSHLVAVFASAVALLMTPVAMGQESKKPAAEILGPKAGAKVGHIEFLEGRIHRSGYPVVLVMPLVGDEHWHVQDEVEGVEADGKFTARIHIGVEKARPGVKYRLVIIVVKDEKEAREKFAPGKQLKNLPVGVPRSERITVERETE